MIFRPATDIDMAQFYGAPQVPVDLYVLDNGRGPIAIGGLAYLDDGAFAVSWVKDEARKHPRDIIKAGRLILRGAAELGIPLFARRDHDEPTSARLLQHLGFEHVSEDLYVFRG